MKKTVRKYVRGSLLTTGGVGVVVGLDGGAVGRLEGELGGAVRGLETFVAAE